jgi:U2 small nuclear ribonucleoprotein A'
MNCSESLTNTGERRIPLFLYFLFLFLLPNTLLVERQHYRLYVISKIPTLKILDFTKIKQSERDRAKRLASSAAGAAMEADAKLEAREAAAAENNYDDNENHNTFEPGEGKSAEESFATQFSVEQKAKIREMVANAASAEEIDRIESLVKRGIFPGDQGPPPPPPLQEEDDAGVGEKRPGEANGGSEAKRQRAN